MKKSILKSIWITSLLWMGLAVSVYALPVELMDARGVQVTISKKPERVVSLVPSATEILFKIGEEKSIVGITYHDVYPPGTSEKTIVGGFFEPSIPAIEKLAPDLIILSDFHVEVKKRFAGKNCILLNINTTSISNSYENIRLLGDIFDQKVLAAEAIKAVEQDLELILKKIDRIPNVERKRVIRLMGRDSIMTPGTDSFQNEMIRAAGGITHDFHKNGKIVDVTKEEWIAFNPQVIYGCGGDKKTAEIFFSLPGWKDVEAVKKGRIYYFSCDLTCRASTNTGYFVSWLAARIYGDAFSQNENLVFKEGRYQRKPLLIDLDYVKDIRIDNSKIYDFLNKTLVIDFTHPMSIVSTLEGQRTNIKTVGNHYSSPHYWAVGHKAGLKGHRSRVYEVIQQSEKDSSFLFTGADMDNLAIRKATFKDMQVYALVTAGVRSNAMRMSKDQGGYYEPGTINIIIMTNMSVSARAMTRAIISATEAKTAALMDMDIRSSYAKGSYRATGTGTDNVLVVEGSGPKLENAGGHTKLGELIARAVYAGVQEAVYKQNGLLAKRNIFQRLKERDITIHGLLQNEKCDCGRDRNEFTGMVEEMLLNPTYAAFIESAFAVSDDYEKGLVKDLTSFHEWSKVIAEKISEQKIQEMKKIISTENLPQVIGIALNAVCNGVYYKK
jgi:iron complex transport system substrate-binding protein